MNAETLPTPDPVPPATPIRPNPEARAQARITVKDTLVYQPAGRAVEDQPVGTETLFERYLRSGEQMYERKGTAGPDWKRLPLPPNDWIDPSDCSQLVLKNQEGSEILVIQTPEQKAETGGKVILLGLHTGSCFGSAEPFARVRPGESMRLEPVDLEKYRVCSAVKSPVRFSLTLTPG